MEKVIIYGCGKYFENNTDFLFDNWDIAGLIDNNKKGTINGRTILGIDAFSQFQDARIIIMIENIQSIIDVACELEQSFGVNYESIILGIDVIPGWKKERGIERISYCGCGCLSVDFAGFKCKVSSIDEYNNVVDVLVNKVYQYRINNEKKDIVFDVGMNIGDSAWFFLNHSSVCKVYAYEPFYDTYNKALYNLSSFVDSKKLECYNYGISNITEERIIVYNGDMSCGMSTISKVTMDANQKYKSWGIAKEKNDIPSKIRVKCASDEFGALIKDGPEFNYILKLDCEGEEYGIIDDLCESGLISFFDIMMIEWHYRGMEPLVNALEEAGFSWWGFNENTDIGLIYAYKTHK